MKFQDTEDVQKCYTLKSIPQQKFQKCFQQWQHCCAKYVAAQGKYFEGDSLLVSS
jgi:hypothetical protein